MRIRKAHLTPTEDVLKFLHGVERAFFAHALSGATVRIYQKELRNDPRDRELNRESLEKWKARQVEMHDLWESRKAEVDQFLRGLNDERHRAILKLRYVDSLRWSTVKKKLAKQGFYYEDRQMFRLHKDAVAEAQKLWSQRKKEPNQ